MRPLPGDPRDSGGDRGRYRPHERDKAAMAGIPSFPMLWRPLPVPHGIRTGMDVAHGASEFKKGRSCRRSGTPGCWSMPSTVEATLLGVVFVMERAGDRAWPRGPITRWHAHNLCVSLTRPG